MNALTDLRAIYASDPEAQPVTSGSHRTRGFFVTGTQLRETQHALQLPVTSVVVRVLAGALGELRSDAVVIVAGVRHRLVAETVPTGDGSEEFLTLIRETP